MRRTQQQWFIEYLSKRGHASINTISGTTTKRGCLQAELDRHLEHLTPHSAEWLGAYDRFQKRKREGSLRAVRVELTWEASR